MWPVVKMSLYQCGIFGKDDRCKLNKQLTGNAYTPSGY